MLKPCTYSELINSIDQKLFKDLNAEIPVDKHNHKLTGQNLFSILLYNICEPNRISLRVIEERFDSHNIRLFHKEKLIRASKSGIAHRLSTINSDYFKKIWQHTAQSMQPNLKEQKQQQIIRCDSTVITISSKLAQCGFPTANGHKTQIKFSVSYNEIPLDVRFGDKLNDISESIALRDFIKEISLSKNDIAVFDRGITSRKSLADISNSQILFVTRLNDNAKYKIITTNNLASETTTESLKILGDYTIQLYKSRGHLIEQHFRLIHAKSLINDKNLYFLTNIVNLEARDITEVYKARWDIEVFFKFIKQHLHTKHFLSRNLNGIKVMFYMIMITAVLMLTFKKCNKIESFLIAKIRFVEQVKRYLTFQLLIIYQNRLDEFKDEFMF